MTPNEKLTEAISWLDPYMDCLHWDECPAYGCDDGECSCRFDEEADERVHDAVCNCSVGAIEKAIALIRASQSEGPAHE